MATALNTAKSGGLIMAAIAQVFTISYVANLLGEDEDWLFELSTDMFPEDGCLWVYGVGEDGVPAFTKDSIENLRQIIADERSAGRAPPQVKPERTLYQRPGRSWFREAECRAAASQGHADAAWIRATAHAGNGRPRGGWEVSPVFGRGRALKLRGEHDRILQGHPASIDESTDNSRGFS